MNRKMKFTYMYMCKVEKAGVHKYKLVIYAY